MRYLVLTDIHANLEALEACLSDSRTRGYDRTLVLGDLVGYGADPNAVVARVQALEPALIVRGNHDKIALGFEQADGFNVVARAAARWTLDVLAAEHREWLAALPPGPASVDELIEICHGSPADEDEYILDSPAARRALEVSARPLCLFGHTHYSASFQLSRDRVETLDLLPSAKIEVALQEELKYLINPGAVGQPRDGDPRARYAIVDTDRRQVELFRVNYPIEEAQEKVVKAGLPEVLAQRLARGR